MININPTMPVFTMMTWAFTMMTFFLSLAQADPIKGSHSYIAENYIKEQKNNITYLDLSNRHISYIDPKAFCNLPYLKILNLSNNNLLYLDPETFRCTPALEKLYLAKNFKLGSFSYHTYLYSPSIKYIDISYDNFTLNDIKMFSRMPKLEKILAIGNPVCRTSNKTITKTPHIYCRNSSEGESRHTNGGEFKIRGNITLLTEDVLANLSDKGMLKLDLSGNNISFITPYALCSVETITSLNLSNNKLQYFDPEIFNCTPFLLNLTLSNNSLFGSTLHQFSLNSESMEYLDISYCNLTTYSKEMFKLLPNLKYINAAGNPICNEIMDMMKHIDIAPCGETKYKNLDILTGEYFSGWDFKTKRVDLSYRNISSIEPSAFCKLQFLEELNLSNNNLHYLDPETFRCLQRLRKVHLENNRHLALGSYSVFLYSQSINMVNISNCHFSSFSDETFSGMPKLRFIYATGNPSCSQTTKLLKRISNAPCPHVVTSTRTSGSAGSHSTTAGFGNKETFTNAPNHTHSVQEETTNNGDGDKWLFTMLSLNFIMSIILLVVIVAVVIFFLKLRARKGQADSPEVRGLINQASYITREVE